MERPAVEVGTGDTVRITKAFGPTIFADIRITCSTEREGWVIERLTGDNEWREAAVIPDQIPDDFTEVE